MGPLIRRLLFLPPAASTVAPGLDALHAVVIATAMLGALAVTVATGAFLVRYRVRRRDPALRHGHAARLPRWLELGVIGGMLSIFLLFWVVGFRQYVALRTPPRDALRIHVVAKQWMWSFAYPDGTASERELRVPAGQPVELLMTSRDVIHSFYVPAFRLKQDVLPGRMTTLWFTATTPGTYDLLCAEYCGTSHSRMLGRIVVVPPEEFARRDPALGEDLTAAGARLAATRGCLRCHTVDGTPHLGPTWAGLYGRPVPLADGTTRVADDAYLTESMMDPGAAIHAGFAPIMPSYLGQLPAPEVGAIVEYIRSLADAPGGDPAAPGGPP